MKLTIYEEREFKYIVEEFELFEDSKNEKVACFYVCDKIQPPNFLEGCTFELSDDDKLYFGVVSNIAYTMIEVHVNEISGLDISDELLTIEDFYDEHFVRKLKNQL